MTEVSSSVYNIVPEYGPYLVWHDLWTDELAGEERRSWFWDRQIYRVMERER